MMRRGLLVSLIAMTFMGITAAVAFAHSITNLKLDCQNGLTFQYANFSETATFTWSGGLVQQVPLSGNGTYQEAIPESAKSATAPTTVQIKTPEQNLSASTQTACSTPPPTCPQGTTGTPPNCVTPTCPPSEVGTPPNCTTPTPPSCAPGQTGTPPNCVTPTPPAPPATTTPPAPPTVPFTPLPPQPKPKPCLVTVKLGTHVLNLDPPGRVYNAHAARAGRCHGIRQFVLRHVKLTHNPSISPASPSGTITFQVRSTSTRVVVLKVHWFVQGQSRGSSRRSVTFHSGTFTRPGTEIYGIKSVVAVVQVKVLPKH